MSEVKIIWDGARMQQLLHSPDGMLGRYMIGRAEVVRLAAQRQSANNGSIPRGIVKRFNEDGGNIGVTIISQNPHSIFVHEGTVPHDIPNAFGWGPTFGIGGRFSGKFHPGNKANRFLSDNLPLFFAA